MKADAPRSYIICSNPRSGTTLLCQMLADAGAGQPDSFFRPADIEFWAKEWGIPMPDDISQPEFPNRYLRAMLREGRGTSEVFGLRLMAENLKEALAWLRQCYPGHETDATLINAAFGPTQFIHLSRHDKLAETVSLIRAQQSGLWHKNADGSVLEQTGPPGQIHYDGALIATQMALLIKHDAAWRTWFHLTGIEPLHLSYESLAAAPNDALVSVLHHIGMDAGRASEVNPGVARLTDAMSRDWITRFQRENPT